MTTPMKGTVPYTGKAGSLIFVSCDVTHRDTGRPAENTENGQCVRAVCDNLKKRLLFTDLSNNRFFFFLLLFFFSGGGAEKDN